MPCEDSDNQISITRGDTETISLTFTDENDAALDITGYTIYFTVKKKADITKDDSFSVIQKDVTTHSNPTGGLSEIVLSNVDTAIGEGDYIYDIQTKDSSGNISTVIFGTFSVTNDVTKRTS